MLDIHLKFLLTGLFVHLIFSVLVECPGNLGDLLTDFNCYVSIVRWLIARPLPPSRERSMQDYPSYPRK